MKELDVHTLLRNLLTYAQYQWLERELPTHLPFPGGRQRWITPSPYPWPRPVRKFFMARNKRLYWQADGCPCGWLFFPPPGGHRPLRRTLAGSGKGDGRICAGICAAATPATTGPKTRPLPRQNRAHAQARAKLPQLHGGIATGTSPRALQTCATYAPNPAPIWQGRNRRGRHCTRLCAPAM